MSNAEDFSAKKAAIEAIPAEQVKTPNMPVSIFIQETENLYRWCQDDKTALTGVGLDWALVEDLSVGAGALREAESNWFKERYSREEAAKEWEIKAPEAYDMRDSLLRAMRYAYRHDNNLLNRVREISEGSGHADMMQDLNDIAVLGQNNAAPLQAINLDLNLLDQAAAKADEMAALLAKVNGDRADNSGAKVMRDKTYTYLKQLVDEVRACGQYVLGENAERLKGYTSPYFRKRRKKSKDAVAAETEAAGQED